MMTRNRTTSRTTRTAIGACLAMLVAVAMMLTMTGTASAATATATSARTGSATVPVTSTATSVNAFTGTLTISTFKAAGGQLVAAGTLSGTVTNALTGVTSSVTQAVTVPVAVTGTCTILDLTLGPLHLNLLGLVVDLNAVHLTITAQQGPGNLLGNLLCAVAHLLDGGLNLNGLVALLNQILAILTA